nr:MAG TPA: Photosystem II protein D1, Photosystem protein [Caudoviricetes sp.]
MRFSCFWLCVSAPTAKIVFFQGAITNNQTAYTIKCCYPAMPIVCQIV